MTPYNSYIIFPIGIATAVYLEEFAPKDNKFVDFIEVNINNLAAVPSIIFGLLGLAIFLNFLKCQICSSCWWHGIIIDDITRIIIPARAALKSVPPSIKNA